MFKLQASLC